MPNVAFQPSSAPSDTLRQVPGGANVDYTAVDYNTMLVALVFGDGSGTPQNPNYGRVITPSLHRQELVRYWINRVNPGAATDLATLTQQWINGNSPPANWTPLEWKQFKRRLVLRPLPEDHYLDLNNNGQWNPGEPYFTGSNPKHNPTLGLYASGFNPLWDPAVDGTSGPLAWDVDNDGDGVPDSIWVDVGLPVVSLPDGRRAKPLAAILCVDLDGRINLNAHGCLAQANPLYYGNMDLTGSPLWFGGNAQAAWLLRGQGWGPAEISLRPLLSAADTQSVINNRYRDAAGTSPGISSRADALGQNKLFNYWNDGATVLQGLAPGVFVYRYNDFLLNPPAFRPSAFGSPPSFKALGAVGLDLRGAPIYALMGQDFEQVDTPYELNLAAKSGSTDPGSADKPFSPAELERVVRPFDADSASLPRRLVGAAPSLVHRRHEVTTESWDLPTPGIALPREIRDRLFDPANSPTRLQEMVSAGIDWYPPRHLRDILAVKMFLDLRANGVPAANIPAIVRDSQARLLPYEMLAGLKMDLNRPLGNGLDDNGNGVVDEPGRVRRYNNNAPAGFMLDPTLPGEILLPPGTPEQLGLVSNTWNAGTQTYGANVVRFEHINGVDVNGDGAVNEADRAMVRQLYARHLYVLGLLLIDHTVANPTSPTAEESARARMVAQWAANVVDFYDRDAIMTPFEYDIAPFVAKNAGQYGNATWNVDGVIDPDPAAPGLAPPSDDTQPYRGLVWGVERPELLISETLAFHDRRTQDLDEDGGTVGGTPADTHADFDQGFRPEGSLFVEFFNPATNFEPKSADFYSGPSGGVDLTRVAPGGAPVWRLAIHATAATDPDDPANPPERSVYFRDASAIPVTGDGYRHFTQNPPTGQDAIVLPGRYAVIGSGRTQHLTSSPPTQTTTYLGFLTSQNPPQGNTSTRRIELFPYYTGNNPNNIYPVQVLQNKNGGSNDLPTSQIQTPVVVVIDRAGTTADSLRLSISEPQGGYPAVDAGGAPITPDDQYTQAYDSPLDRYQPGGTTPNSPDLWQYIAKDGTHANFRIIHLQRLANPLLPWDAKTNPYRTVDTSPVDLTTFNGVTSTPEPPPDGGDAPIDPSIFMARERGNNTASDAVNSPWRQEPLGVDPDDTLRENPSPNPVTGHHFNSFLSHTLGYLNWSLNRPDAMAQLGPRDATWGVMYQGDPRGQPFPWLTWNNRPFASPLELLLVPGTDARYLLANPNGLPGGSYPFGKVFAMAAAGANPYQNPNDLFAHLMNFFLQQPPAGGLGQPNMMHRLLEFVRVPSPFVGTETQLNPQVFAANPGHIFPPPFHHVSTYREPGRINLNTLASADGWKGLLNRQDLGHGDLQDVFLWSRQGYGASVAAVGALDPAVPTRFARPFRSSAGKYLVPPILINPAGNPEDPNNWVFSSLVGDEIHCTLLRGEPSAGSPPSRPLLAFDSTKPANAFPVISEANHPDRNPYFRYQPLMRMGNLTTGRSNVFAVWITVGFFEALPAPLPANPAEAADHNAVYPEGFAWGQEIGLDTGEVKRHRAFYLIDRTIPVGFQRGMDLNAEKAILLKRFIE